MSDQMDSMDDNLEQQLRNYKDKFFRETVDAVQVWESIKEQVGAQEPPLRADLELQQALSDTTDHQQRARMHTPSADASYSSTLPTNVWEWARDEISGMSLIEKLGEVKEICAKLRREDVRLLTLTGPSGIGKTRLALEAAVELLDSFSEGFPDGVFFVSLATTATTARDHKLVVPTIVQTLGIANVRVDDENDEIRVEELMKYLKSYLKNKRMLLLLDRFDRVRDAHKVVDEILEGTSYLKVLVTKLDKLGAKGEILFPVQPLTLPHPDLDPSEPFADFLRYGSVRLLYEEVQAVNPHFIDTRENREIVAQICRLVGGSPLALQLVAARAGDIPLGVILQQLREGEPIFSAKVPENEEALSSYPRNVLDGVIDWSYKQLNPEQQALYRGLGIFWGGRTLESIKATCFPGSNLSTEDLSSKVNPLVKMKLLQPYEGVCPYEGARGEQRYWMREPIHDHSREQLKSHGEDGQFWQRHADYFLAFVEEAKSQIELSSSQQAEWRSRLKNELENIRKALRNAKDNEDNDRETELGHAMSWVLQKLGTIPRPQPSNSRDKEFIFTQTQLSSQALEGVRLTLDRTEELSDQERQMIKILMQIIAYATQSINLVLGDTLREQSEMSRVEVGGNT